MQISNLRKKLLVALSEREFYNSIAVVGDSNAPFFAGHECIYITKDNLPDLNFKDKKCFSFDLGTPCFSYYIESTIYSIFLFICDKGNPAIFQLNTEFIYI